MESYLTDETILQDLGRRLARCRLNLGLTQAALAEQAGVSKRTVERVEAGDSTQMSTMIRIMRVLGLLEALDGAIPEVTQRPLDLLRMKGKQRQRASSKTRPAETEDSWSWDDEE